MLTVSIACNFTEEELTASFVKPETKFQFQLVTCFIILRKVIIKSYPVRASSIHLSLSEGKLDVFTLLWHLRKDLVVGGRVVFRGYSVGTMSNPVRRASIETLMAHRINSSSVPFFISVRK